MAVTTLPRARTGCLPQHCEMGGESHRHCVCGQWMRLDARLCDDCEREGLELAAVVREDEEEGWDGRLYPSRRRHRIPPPDPDAYGWLLLAIVDPELWQRRMRAVGRMAA